MASVVSSFETSAVMSMPTSAIAWTEAGLTWSTGGDPAHRISIPPADSSVENPVAIWDRLALWTHPSSTDGLSVTKMLLMYEEEKVEKVSERRVMDRRGGAVASPGEERRPA